MDITLQYIISFIPTIIAILSEIAVIAKFISAIKESKNSNEYQEMVKQNKLLLEELRETKKLNKEYLTKIDHIYRGNGDESKTN